MDAGDVLISSVTSAAVPKSHPVEMDTNCEFTNHAKYMRSLRRRRGINYSQFNYSSEEESEFEKLNQDLSSKPKLPKGVIRGCLDCSTCQKVKARWRPEDACKPIIGDAPVFYPTEEEFKDTLKYISSIRPIAERYGICRIVPPSSWNPPCPLKEKQVWENSKFPTRIQQLDKLQNRDSMRTNSRNYGKMRKKRRRCLDMGVDCGLDGNSMKQNGAKNSNENERFGFEPGMEFTLDSFQKYADDFKRQYFSRDDNVTDTVGDRGFRRKQWEPSVENLEGEYWRMVEKPTEEVEVLYGADIETGKFGSGFPKVSFQTEASKYDDKYLKSGWNLNNFPRLPGSVLAFESSDISGVVVPWLYVGMCFSSFCWHVEDHHLYSLNYMHWGAPKVWYGVPGKDAVKLEAAMKKHLPDLFEEQPDLLHKLVTQLSPSVLISEGVPVYRCVQNPREFVLTFPRAYHSGFNCGFNCAEAVNVAPVDWLPHGQNAIELYCEQGRKTSISHDKLLLGAAREAVKAHWELVLLRKNNSDNLRWKDFCGKDGILAKALKARAELEHSRREHVDSSNSVKMDIGFDATSEKECFVCLYDLHLSAVSCLCAPERFACLLHREQLCSGACSGKKFLFRYEIYELNIFIEALEGKLSAVCRWVNLDLGLTLSKYLSVANLQIPYPNKNDSHSSETGKRGECDSLDAGSSTSIADIPLCKEPKTPLVRVTSFNHLISKPPHSILANQTERGILGTLSQACNSGDPISKSSQKIELSNAKLSEHVAKESATRNVVTLSRCSIKTLAHSEQKSPDALLAPEKVNDLHVRNKSPCRKENLNHSSLVRVERMLAERALSLGPTSSRTCKEDAQRLKISQDASCKVNSLDCSTAVYIDNPSYSFPTCSTTSLSVDGNIKVINDEESEDQLEWSPIRTTEDSFSQSPEVFARLVNCDKTVSPCNQQKDKMLDTPDTNATVMNEGDVDLIANMELENNLSNLEILEVGKHAIDTKLRECNFTVSTDAVTIPSDSRNISKMEGCSTSSLDKTTTGFATREAGVSNNANVESIPQIRSFDPKKLSRDQIVAISSNLNLTGLGRPSKGSIGSTSGVLSNLEKHCHQKGPRIAKVVRRINCHVEPVELGVIRSGKLWSSSQAIYPHGFRSRVAYLSVIDPTKMCSYVSQILDSGSLGPLFMVSVEEHPNEVFIHTAASKCWELVRERVNQEIRKQFSMGRAKLPLQPPGSVDGLEMFGFTSPEIVVAIEALDHNRVCIEYWNSRAPSNSSANDAITKIKDLDNRKTASAGMEAFNIGIVFKSLLKKASPEELHTLYSILSDNKPTNHRSLASLLLDKEIQSRRK
ncbi:hypothetical protein Scep_029937 [Stephania cephalantha]|uniref:Lysine-specific demethylase JMJ16 n=1 Tax=Stephania cephalantha TaxID=152367 RepID=A0AAP0DYV3_9MAGN